MGYRKLYLLGAILLSVATADIYAQQNNDTARQGTIDAVLGEVTVNAFQSKLPWKTVPAAVAIISSSDMKRYAGVSMVPVLNTVPGVRMEERSPASYRLSVRGSLLRSPFGVRNVKVYWNEIPLSDGSGNTYLNLVELNQLTGMEMIKGPAASRYGAGTGGALLLKTDLPFRNKTANNFTAGITGGSYGMLGQQFIWKNTGKQFSSWLQQSHQQADGFREQSASRRDVLQWQAAWQIKQQQIRLLLFYTDLYYQTPGGITLAQMQLNPKLARQPAGSQPGAVQQKTAIYNKTVFAGVQHELPLSGEWMVKSFFSANTTDFTNPFITNFEKRKEDNFGMGTNLVYHISKGSHSFQWMTGAEWLYNQSRITDFGNRSGIADTIQFTDNIFTNQWFAYSQLQWLVNNKWNFTAGVSINNQLLRYKRLTDLNTGYVNRNIKAVVTPRLALLYKLTKNISLYTLAAKGFSPPSLAEVRPSDGNYYGDLAAEEGWNFETGVKGEAYNGRLHFDLAAYFFTLRNAIVRRNSSNGAEYFVNAGEVKQHGMEAALQYQLRTQPNGFISSFKIWSSYSFQPFRFTDYQQSNLSYSGNQVTGVPRNIWVSGVDMENREGIYLNASVNVNSRIPLTDANDAFAEGYQLVQAKGGFRNHLKGCDYDLFMGVDNLLNQLYSLGNDINAFGKRYFNPAAKRNIFIGLVCHF